MHVKTTNDSYEPSDTDRPFRLKKLANGDLQLLSVDGQTVYDVISAHHLRPVIEAPEKKEMPLWLIWLLALASGIVFWAVIIAFTMKVYRVLFP